jgi:hypothetical protein
MNSRTEQLMRDYLNRLSMASNGKLSPADRQALLDRTRARIEADCGGTSNASATDVRKALAGLGDPIALVELELTKVQAADRGRAELAAQVDEVLVGGGGASEASVASRRPRLPALARLAVKGNDIPRDSSDVEQPNGAKPATLAVSVRSLRARFAPVHRVGIGPASRSATSAEPVAVPAQREADLQGHSSDGVPELLAAPEPVPPPGDPETGDGQPTGPINLPRSVLPGSKRPPGSARPANSARGAPGQQARRANANGTGAGVLSGSLLALLAIARRNKVEVLAVGLLGIGGAIFPPIWLLGALVALPSKKWDTRDKFLGITVPVLVVIVGTVLVIVFGGQHNTIGSYAFEAWLGAERLSRIAAAGGAIYLLWGLRRGRRKPKLPPWNQPHRFG